MDAVPRNLIDTNLCIQAVRAYGAMLFNIPKEFWTYEVCLEAVKSDGYIIQFIPDEFKDIEMYKASVASYGITIFYLPEHERTLDLWKKALSSCDALINYIPKEQTTNELKSYAKFCRFRNAHASRGYDSVEIVREMRSSVEETCDALINEDTPYDMLKAIVGLWPLNIGGVSEKQYTHELLLIASKTGGLSSINKKFITAEMCYNAIKHDSFALYNEIPKQMIDKKICKIALMDYAGLFDRIPYKYRDRELVTIAIDAVKNDKADISLKSIPSRFRTKNTCLIFIERDANNINFIPKHFHNKKFYDEALEKNPKCIGYIPAMYLTYRDYMPKYHPKPDMIKYMPDKYKTQSFCEFAIRFSIEFIQYIPKKYITSNIVNYIKNELSKHIYEENTFSKIYRRF